MGKVAGGATSSRKRPAPDKAPPPLADAYDDYLASEFVPQPRLAQPRGLQPHRDADNATGVPAAARRPLLMTPRAHALASMLAAMVGAPLEAVLLRCDALEALLEIHAR